MFERIREFVRTKMGNTSKHQINEQLAASEGRLAELIQEERQTDDEWSEAALNGADDLALGRIRKKLNVAREKLENERRRIDLLKVAREEQEASDAEAAERARKERTSKRLARVTAASAALDNWTVQGAKLLREWQASASAVVDDLPNCKHLSGAQLLKDGAAQRACELRLYGLAAYGPGSLSSLWLPRAKGLMTPLEASKLPTLEELARAQHGYVLEQYYPDRSTEPQPPEAA